MRIILRLFGLAALLLVQVNVFSQDTNLWVFLCFGQSNMEGFPGIQEQDKTGVDERFQVLAAVDFPKLGREKGHWYPAIPPLCRPSTGLCPADYFGRTLVSNLPPQIKVGVVNISVAGCKMELFEKDSFQAYAASAPNWMTNIINICGGNPYQYLVEMGRLAQADGVIKGILLHQGESNTNDKEWPKKVKGIYDNLIQDLKTPEEYITAVTTRYGKFADDLIRAYPVGSNTVPKTARDLTRDAAFGWHTWTWARLQSQSGKAKVYYYYFDQHPDYPEDSPKAGFGTPHGADVAYVFQHLNPKNQERTKTDLDISKAMSRYWVNFAKHGDPNGEGLPEWPAFSDSNPQVMHFNQKPHPGPVPSAEALKALDDYFAWRRTPEGETGAK